MSGSEAVRGSGGDDETAGSETAGSGTAGGGSGGSGTAGGGSGGSGTAGGGSGGRHTAGAFDVRVVIAALIGVFGVVLLITGLVNSSDADLAKQGGVNANLWSGIVMIVVGLGFAAWTRLRPIVVPAPSER